MACADAVGWLVTATCLAGTVLNVRRCRWCFHLWTIGNVAWLAIDLSNRLYSRAFLDLVQLALAVWGIFAWRQDSSNLPRSEDLRTRGESEFLISRKNAP